jgi:hypothetical protein
MLFIYVGAMCSIIHYGSKAIKKHITYPRTGFVQYRKRDTAWRPLLIGMVVSMLASIALIRALRSGWEITTPASLTGLLFAAAYAFGIARSVPWKWAVVCLMVTGSLVIAVLPAGLVGALANDSWITADFPPQAVGAFLLNFMLFGTLLLVSGGASFWLYLRDTRPPVQEAS